MDAPVIKSTEPRVEEVQYCIEQGNKLYSYYKQLIDSYVLDFYTCSHWETLPSSWRTYFDGLSSQELSDFLDLKPVSNRHGPPPLSLLAVRKLICYLSLPRFQLIEDNTDPRTESTNRVLRNNNELIQDAKITKLFWKNVKDKKRYELSAFAKYTYQTAIDTECQIIVDVGAGLGHLCRLLSYGYGMEVIGIDAQEQLVHHAKKLDNDLEKLARKYNPSRRFSNHPPVHIKLTIQDNLHQDKFMEILKLALNKKDKNFPFGIVGLHPCGDLGPVLLRLFKTCPNVRFVNIVGCCYMKLTSGYPLSEFCIKNANELSYNAREIACHAKEVYIEKLRSGKDWELKVHAYRAALEKIISTKYPKLKRVGLSSVKYTPDMTFMEYCHKALKKLHVDLLREDVCSAEIRNCLENWKHVVTFYTIRLAFAPLIETLIILDRYLYLKEDGQSLIKTIFDPKISPRNFVVTGLK